MKIESSLTRRVDRTIRQANSARQFWGWTVILAVTNLVPALYISTVHQRGAVLNPKP